MKRAALGLAIAGVILVVGLVVLYSSSGTLITRAITTAGPKILLTTVDLKETTIDATTGKGSLNGLVIGNPKGFKTESAFRMDKVEITLDMNSITSDTVIVKKVDVQSPEVTYELGGSGSNINAIQNNVEMFVKRFSGDSKSDEKSSSQKSGTKMVIDHVYVKNGKVNISSTLLGGKSLSVPLPDIHLQGIGKNNNGATPGEVVKTIISALNKAILKAVAPLNLDKAGEIAGKTIKGTKDLVEGTTKGVGDTLGKGAKGLGDAVSGILGK